MKVKLETAAAASHLMSDIESSAVESSAGRTEEKAHAEDTNTKQRFLTDLQISFILHLYHPQYFQAKVIVFWKYKSCTKAYVNTKYIQTVKSATVQDRR